MTYRDRDAYIHTIIDMGENNREMEKIVVSGANVKNYQEGLLTRRVDACFLNPACLCFHRKHIYNKWNHIERLNNVDASIPD